MNNGSKWSKYKNKATGDIVEARQNTKFPGYQLLRQDEGNFGGVKTCTSMLVTDFEKGYIKVKQRYFYVVYQYDKKGEVLNIQQHLTVLQIMVVTST